MATSPPPPPAVAAPRALETGTKLHVSNLNASVTVEDVQVVAVLQLLLLLRFFRRILLRPFQIS
jgi:hypothetical protein